MRRTLISAAMLFTVALLILTDSPTASPPLPALQSSSNQGKAKAYVLKQDEGERLPDPRGGIIKVSPQTGARHVSMVVQPLPAGKRIGVHMHEHDEEVFFVHKGAGTVVLDDKRTPVEEGSVVYIPPGTWHGFEAGGDMQLVWLISPPHFVDLYRLFFKPGFEPTKEEGERLKRKYGFRDKPPQ